MIKTVFFILLVVFAVSGLCELIHTASSLLLKPKGRRYSVCVIKLGKGSAVKQIRYSFEQLRWHGDAFASHIIAISSDIDSAELEECRRISENLPVTLCPEDTVGEIAQSILPIN